MSSVKKVFKLFSQCIPAKGARRSVVYDLQRNEYELMPNALYKILTEQQDLSLEELKASYDHEFDETIDEYFSFLEAHEFGFWTTTPELFPSLPLDWEEIAEITHAIIDINAESSHDFETIFNQLQELGCEHLQLRVYDEYSIAKVSEALALTDDSIFKSIELFLKYDEAIDEQEYARFMSRFPRIERLFIHSSPENKSFTEDKSKRLIWDVFFIKQKIDSHHHCGAISSQYFASNIYAFTEALQHNSCLNRKISVDVDGNIKNCPSMATSYGNVKVTTLRQAYENESFTRLWSVTKDQVNVCQDCEFRYICTDCRANLESDDSLQQPAKCEYNPYKAKWKGEEGYVSVTEMKEEEIKSVKVEHA